MKRVMAAILAVLVAMTSACSREAEDSAAESGETETLSLYSTGGRAGPVSQLGLAVTELTDALLVSPHQSIAFSGWAVAKELTGEQLSTAGVVIKDGQGLPTPVHQMRAPEGHELLMVDAADAGVIPISRNDAMNKVSFTLVVGGVSRPLGNSLFAYNVRDALLAVVPAGAEVRLDLTDEGRTQSLDLRTGKRINAAAAFYPVREASVSPSEVWRYRGRTYTTVSAGITSTLTPWSEEKGWAPVGRAWLTGKVSATVTSVELPDTSKVVRTPAAITVDLGRDLRLSGTGVPSRLFPAGTSLLAIDPANDPGIPEEAKSRTFTVDVPETLSKFTVAFTTDVTTAGYVRDAKLSDGSREVTLKAPKR